MLDRGWAVTAEVGGVTANDGLGPHAAASIAWVRRRDQELTVVLGGRNLGTAPTMLVVDVQRHRRLTRSQCRRDSSSGACSYPRQEP